jgi:hypothetical protein
MLVVGLLFAAHSDAVGASSERNAAVPALKAQEVRRFSAPDAFQGVAVDAHAFYAISDNRITKYDKATGRRSATWSDRSNIRWSGHVLTAKRRKMHYRR